jgi:hypothetical protein
MRRISAVIGPRTRLVAVVVAIVGYPTLFGGADARLAAATTPNVASVWRVQVGRLGPAVITSLAGEAQLSVDFHGLEPSARFAIALRNGACGTGGATIAQWAGVASDEAGRLGHDYGATASEGSSLFSGATISISVEPGDQCATLAAPQSCAAAKARQTWRDLVLIYPSTSVTYTRPDGTRTPFTASFSPEELSTVRSDAMSLPGRVSSMSQGEVAMDVSVVIADHPLRSLSSISAPVIGRGYVVGVADVREDLDRFAPIGTFDVVTVVAKGWNDQEAVPFFSWGIAYSPTLETNDAGLTSVVSVSRSSGAPGYVMIHEWLHIVVDDLRDAGYSLPSVDQYAGGEWGPPDEARDTAAITSYMRGQVTDGQGKALGGLTSDLWQFATPTVRPRECPPGG